MQYLEGSHKLLRRSLNHKYFRICVWATMDRTSLDSYICDIFYFFPPFPCSTVLYLDCQWHRPHVCQTLFSFAFIIIFSNHQFLTYMWVWFRLGIHFINLKHTLSYPSYTPIIVLNPSPPQLHTNSNFVKGLYHCFKHLTSYNLLELFWILYSCKVSLFQSLCNQKSVLKFISSHKRN